MVLKLIRICVLLCIALPLYAQNRDVAVTGLRCNDQHNPLGVDDLNPSLSWKLESAVRGQHQTAYQLVVGTSKALDERSALWNSGKVSSSQSVHIRYTGPALEF